MRQVNVILPPGTVCFPCEERFESVFLGWELEGFSTEPDEPKGGMLLIYDCLLPTETWMPICKAVQDQKTKRITSVRLMNRPEMLREHGEVLTPDENGNRVFKLSDAEEWHQDVATYAELSHYAAIAPNGDVWILDKERASVIVAFPNDDNGGN